MKRPRLGPKDYRVIGNALRAFLFSGNAQDPKKVVEAIADVFEQDNPNFDRARFLRFVETGEDKR